MVDVDGVLVRGRPDDGRPWSDELERDLGLRAEELQRAFFVPHWEDIVLGRAALRDRLTPVLAMIAPHLTPERLIAYWFAQDSRLDGGLLAEVADLRRRGLEVHLATNQEHHRADHLMRVVGLSRHVDDIHYSAAIGCRKPAPDFFREVAGRVRRLPAELILIDDARENVRAARAAGWSAIHWTGDKSLSALLGEASCSVMDAL